jgi:hypothetical protein
LGLLQQYLPGAVIQGSEERIGLPCFESVQGVRLRSRHLSTHPAMPITEGAPAINAPRSGVPTVAVKPITRSQRRNSAAADALERYSRQPGAENSNMGSALNAPAAGIVPNRKRRCYQRRSGAPTRGTGPLRLALAGATRSGSAGVGSLGSRSAGEATPHLSGVNLERH